MIIRTSVTAPVHNVTVFEQTRKEGKINLQVAPNFRDIQDNLDNVNGLINNFNKSIGLEHFTEGADGSSKHTFSGILGSFKHISVFRIINIVITGIVLIFVLVIVIYGLRLLLEQIRKCRAVTEINTTRINNSLEKPEVQWR